MVLKLGLAFEGQDHPMDGGWGHAEAALDVGLGGRPQVDAHVGIDESEILALGGRETGVCGRQTFDSSVNSTAPRIRRRR